MSAEKRTPPAATGGVQRLGGVRSSAEIIHDDHRRPAPPSAVSRSLHLTASLPVAGPTPATRGSATPCGGYPPREADQRPQAARPAPLRRARTIATDGYSCSSPAQPARGAGEGFPPPLLVYTGDHGPLSPDQGDVPPPVSPKWRLQNESRRLLPGEKNLAKCYRTPRAGAVEVFRSATRRTAAYRGLCTCRSVWQCPVCSARIAATRAEELTAAIRQHRDAGGTVLLATFTASHTRLDDLGDLLTRHRVAHARFWAARSVKQALARVGLVGRVSAQEVTCGHAAGWHPHRHVLLFVDGSADPSDLADALSRAWTHAAERSGLTASIEHGFDLRGGQAAGNYVAKLGLEVALAVRKKGRSSSSFGIWQLLEESAAGDTFAGRLFVEFAGTMKGRRHLVWSDGLKARFGLDEVTDDEIMEAGGDQDEALLATLTRDLWRGVLANDLRGELLACLGIDDRQEAADLLRAFGLDPSGLSFASAFQE